MTLRRVTLEMSLKPFRRLDDATVREVCRTAFGQWLPLLRDVSEVAVLLWSADGSEILDYPGDLDATFEWAKYIGGCNREGRANAPGDPDGGGLHSRSYLYCDDPPTFTYRDLARVVATLKEMGRRVTGKPVSVGATFDPGPEFAESPFKYRRHPEICLAGTMGSATFVTCYATLDADDHAYAGYPDGIPRGTSVGTFLGRQSQRFLTDLGFDYLWLSNGFGFGLETWKTTGALFDGERFRPELAAATREQILGFWRDFRRECPDLPLETRGTNLAVGIDLASDATPYRDIYHGGFNAAPPPNSPWAALNGDFGLELVGYLSRIADLPDTEFPFRYYTHDPWWLNSPWLDRYGREPHDIYLPLSAARLDADGVARRPSTVEFLTIDDSYGRMPEQVPNEVIPHLRAALDHAPDAPGPVVWIYPFAEQHELTFGPSPRLEEVFYGDWMIRAAVNAGLPVNTVISSTHAVAALAAAPSRFADSVLLSRVPDAGSPLVDSLLGQLERGGSVLLYGPLTHADPALLDALGVRLAAGLEGEVGIEVAGVPDTFGDPRRRGGSSLPAKTIHRSLFCAGGLEAVLAEGSAAEVWATASAGGETRVVGLTRAVAGGRVVWVRGTNAASYRGGHLLTPDDPAEWLDGGLLFRYGLDRLGWRFAVDAPSAGHRLPLTVVARRANGFYFSGYTPNTTVGLRLRTPAGAPLLLGYETELVDGCATYRLPRAWHRECRVFVDQRQGELACLERHPGAMGIRRRFLLTGLDQGIVRFYPEAGTVAAVRLQQNASYPYQVQPPLPVTRVETGNGVYLETERLSGTVLISW